ncbi:MFS transporter [Blastomyces dermatitidis ER-3]|uniref:MFS transporter n=1 Tax=Ajellomyces dermatitidis (strain ER-3 / ATCC MYA-2586) TaxID=559297 RepID=A0ABP2EYB9_AJEDR|nr:MFS transporter [Blastomyces dermatitidis ER-3]EEQ88899.2 MFS transporter [Blastomyces dermatitidis ER-3]EQL31431.1 hypothetical protein BDFG_06252 [Blastomyces dermatitidis ATCC 26199]
MAMELETVELPCAAADTKCNSASHISAHNTFESTTPSITTSSAERWNYPKRNFFRFIATNYSFVILGINDAAYGALIPYLETYYDVSYTVISLVFLSPLAGYITSAILNNMLHMRFGQRGPALLGPATHVIAYVIVCLHPPYPVLVIAFIIAGFANGLADAAWNAWVGGMANANELLGLLHGSYGLGALLAPTIATSLITKAGWQWYEFYYLVAGSAFLELVFLGASFWNATAAQYRETHQRNDNVSHSAMIPSDEEQQQHVSKRDIILSKIFGNSRTAEAAKNKITWICAFFLIAYVGIEVALGGWIVTFMIRVRHASNFASGMASTGFWAGITVGRVVLGFVTPRLFTSEKHAVTVYLGATVVLELLFWLIPQFVVSAVMAAFLGFFLGPLFPAAVIAATKLLPKHLHVSAIGFAAALGASGATILPFAVGAIAQVKGVQVLQPIVLAMLVVDAGIWLCLPSLSKKNQ